MRLEGNSIPSYLIYDLQKEKEKKVTFEDKIDEYNERYKRFRNTALLFGIGFMASMVLFIQTLPMKSVLEGIGFIIGSLSAITTMTLCFGFGYTAYKQYEEKSYLEYFIGK